MKKRKNMGRMGAGGKEKQKKSSTLDLINTIMHLENLCMEETQKKVNDKQ